MNESKNAPKPILRLRQAEVVWFVWAVLSVSLIAYVARYGYNVPYYDEWNLIPLLDGPVNANWLWEQHNWHRIPFPKLILVGLLFGTGWDFRSGMFFDAVALIALAALLIRTSEQVRGKLSYADAFFPIFLLHWGNYDYLLWNWQLNQMIPVGIVLVILSVIVTRGLRPGSWALMLSSVAVILLPLSGVNGLAYTPGLAAWLLLAGVQSWRSRTKKARLSAIVAWCCGGLSLFLIPVYFSGLKFAGPIPVFFSGLKFAGPYDSGLSTKLGLTAVSSITATGASFVAQGLGPGGIPLAPVSWLVIAGATVICFARILHLAWKERDARHYAFAALLFLVGLAGLIGAVSMASAPLAPGANFPSRYALQAAPVFCWVFLVSGRNKLPFAARSAQAALALLAIAAVGGNFVVGRHYAQKRDQQLAALTADLKKGAPPSLLIAKHQQAMFPFPEEGGASFHDSLGYWLEVIHRARLGAFAKMGRDPSFREVPVGVAVSGPPSDSTDGRTWSFAEPRFVYGIRVRGHPLQTVGRTITLSWTAGDLGFSADRRCLYWNPPPGPQDRKFDIFTCWVYGMVSDLKIASEPSFGDLSLMEVYLLIPRKDD
jgi:hypothetical protein